MESAFYSIIAIAGKRRKGRNVMCTTKILRFKIPLLLFCSLWTSQVSAQNDHFTNAIDISHLQLPTSYHNFTNPETAELNEPAHAGQNAEHSTWLRWTPPQSGVYSIRDWSAPDDTRIAIYTGNT